MTAKDVVTRPTAVDPAEYVDGLEGRRCTEGARLLEIFGRATGGRAVMWGPSMIGYGEVHYRYATGRKGDTFQLGSSPRRADLALYGIQGSPRSEELVAHAWESGPGTTC